MQTKIQLYSAQYYRYVQDICTEKESCESNGTVSIIPPRLPTPSRHQILSFEDTSVPCDSYYASFALGASVVNRCDKLDECTKYHLKDIRNSSMIHILENFRNATSIDMFMHRLKLKGASDVLIRLKERNVSIRIIVDKIYNSIVEVGEYHSCAIVALRNAGIEVYQLCQDFNTSRTVSFPINLHSKFIIVDKSLYIGDELDWSWSGLIREKKRMVLSRDEEIVRHHINHFELIYNKTKVYWQISKTPSKPGEKLQAQLQLHRTLYQPDKNLSYIFESLGKEITWDEYLFFFVSLKSAATLDVYMSSVGLIKLTNALLAGASSGIKIRIVTNRMDGIESLVRDSRIEVRRQLNQVIITRQKQAIILDKYMMFAGGFNFLTKSNHVTNCATWFTCETQAVCKSLVNFEYFCTTCPRLITKRKQ